MSGIIVDCGGGGGKSKIEPPTRPAVIVGGSGDDGVASKLDTLSVGVRGTQCARCMWKLRRSRKRHEREEKRMDETACVMQSRKKK